MSDIEKTDLDEFACIQCGHRYVRHQLRETFCDNCNDILKVKKVEADMVNHPPHYKDASGIECIEVTKYMSFLGGNCFKYLYRAGSKGDAIEDLKKAAWYAERAHEQKEVVSHQLLEDIWLISSHRSRNISLAIDFIAEDMWLDAKQFIEREIARLESE